MTFVAGDTGSRLRLTCKDSETGNVIPLTGATVRLKWNDAAGALQEKTMTIESAIGGIVYYDFLADELFGNKMKFEVEIEDSGGNILRNPTLVREDVRPALA